MTEERIAELGKIDVKSLPLNQAIKYVKGKGERTLYIFSDPDCPYCQRLEQNMVGVDNVTVYVFLYPLTSLHPNAEKVSNQIWCSKTLQKLGQIICLTVNCQRLAKAVQVNSEKYCFRPEIKYRWHTNSVLTRWSKNLWRTK